MARDDLSFVMDPFTADIHTVSVDFQEKVLKKRNDLTAQGLCKQSTELSNHFSAIIAKVKKFWSGLVASYPDISLYAVRWLLPFASTYLCKSGFSFLSNTNSKQRNRLITVESCLRCSLFNTIPNIEKLVSDERIQKSGSKPTKN